MAVFGKGLSNGYPLGAVIGKESVMQAAQDSFISSTYFTEDVGYSAALAVLDKFETCQVPEHINSIGEHF